MVCSENEPWSAVPTGLADGLCFPEWKVSDFQKRMPPERQAVLFLHTWQVATEAEEQRVAKEAEVLREAEKLFGLSFCRKTFVSLPTSLRGSFALGVLGSCPTWG